MNACLRVFGDVLRQGGVGRVVPSWCGDGHWDAVQALSGLQKVFSHVDDFLARRLFDHAGFDGVGDGLVPSFTNVLNFAAHTRAVNLSVGRQRTHHHGDVVLVPFAVGDVGEQKGFSIGLSDAAPELPSDQGVHFGVFVDLSLHSHQETRAVQGL